MAVGQTLSGRRWWLPGKKVSDVRVGLVAGGKFQQLGQAEAEQAGDDQVGKLLDADVVVVDAFIVVLAAVGDAVFQPADTLLQVLKRLVGLQFGPCSRADETAERARMTFSRVSCS